MIEPNATTPEKTPAIGQNPSPEPLVAPAPVEQLWLTRQVAQYMQVSLKTIYNRRKNGLPYVLVGGAVRFVPQDVKDYVASNGNVERHRQRQAVRKGGKL